MNRNYPLPVTLFVLLYILVISIAFAIRIYSGVTKWTQRYSMWVIHGLLIPLCHLIIPFGFLASFYFTYFRNKCKQYKKRKSYAKLVTTSSPYLVSKSNTAPSNKVPSSTFYKVSYTNEFTDVNEAA